MATDDEVTQGAIRNGLHPRILRQMLSASVSNASIAAQHGLTIPQLKMIADRWGQAHLMGREKSNVTIIRECREA